MHTIRVTDYGGDLDTLREVIIIFGFDTAAERDAEIARLYAISDIGGWYDFEPSTIPGESADTRCHVSRLAGADDHIAVSDAIYDAIYDLNAHLPATS